MVKNKPDLSRVKLLILDVDGVLTDAKFNLTDTGESFRSYNMLDGYGIVQAIKKGLNIAVITGGDSLSIVKRCEMLGIKHLFLKTFDKEKVYEEKLKPLLNIEDSDVAYMGDDVFDIPLLKKVGVALSVPNAHPKVKEVAEYITTVPGGSGAVREIIDMIMDIS